MIRRPVLSLLFLLLISTQFSFSQHKAPSTKTRVIITSDGEIDDECSMIRFLLYANEWDIEGIITSSSQYHWHGHKWAGDDWLNPIYNAYSTIYPNLKKHNKNYPSPDYLRKKTFLGNVETEGEMDSVTQGSAQIVKVLIDETDNRPVWLQAWGGTNTIARALKTIQEKYPNKMKYVANKIRFFFIWEQDSTYQSYIKPHWGKYKILTIISDQFEAIAYRWKKVLPADVQPFFEAAWMKKNILENHGALCAIYKAHKKEDKDFNDGDFRSEGDSPAFLHTIETGLNNLNHPDWGGWGGRYVNVRDNTWLDWVPDTSYRYPEGRWYGSNGWGRASLRDTSSSTKTQRDQYFKPIAQWAEALQNDFAARADWCVTSYKNANHPPNVKLAHLDKLNVRAGSIINLSAVGTSDPDNNQLSYHWWQYKDAGSFKEEVKINNINGQKVNVIVPKNATKGESIHIICEVRDNGIPQITRYKRVIIKII